MKWEPDLEALAEKPFFVKYVGLSDRGTLLWINIAGTVYVYRRAMGADPIKKVAATFQKMMKHSKAGGRALAWLKKNAEYTGTKMAAAASKGKVEQEETSAETLITQYLEAKVPGEYAKLDKMSLTALQGIWRKMDIGSMSDRPKDKEGIIDDIMTTKFGDMWQKDLA